MAFNGYLIKVGTYTFPTEYILFDTYKPVRGVQDLDSYRDGNGVLHRNALDHDVYKVEFQTRPMTNKEFDVIMNSIRNQFTIAKEKKAVVDSFFPELGTYSGPIDMYMPDVEVQIQQIIDATTLKYNTITWKFIGY